MSLSYYRELSYLDILLFIVQTFKISDCRHNGIMIDLVSDDVYEVNIASRPHRDINCLFHIFCNTYFYHGNNNSISLADTLVDYRTKTVGNILLYNPYLLFQIDFKPNELSKFSTINLFRVVYRNI